MHKPILIEKIFPLIGNIFLPAFIFSAFLFGFYINETFSHGFTNFLHFGFYIISFCALLFLIYFNKGQPFFIFCITIIAYTFINLLKHLYAQDYTHSSAYVGLSILLPLNLIFFYFYTPRSFLNKKSVWVLISFLFQFSIIEYISRHSLNTNALFIQQDSNLSVFSYLSFFILFAIITINAIRTGSNNDYNLLFATISIFMALYHSDTASGLCAFFSAASLCLISASAQNIYNETYKDTLTGLDSRNSFIIHSKNFPFKYCIGIISIDDYDKLGTNFNKRTQDILTKLIAEEISETEKEENIYRYSPDEFVIVYKNIDKKEGFERLEAIRRAIASAQFQFNNRHKPLKLTVSACISEKKRSDASSFEVLVRADKALQKTRCFSHNVTTKA
ncbi:MAG: diguanylate cyclase [Alphaproteobacteria bacterium]|nr:diguanylate cyclase [Alphaproteobacteria bacterium]